MVLPTMILSSQSWSNSLIRIYRPTFALTTCVLGSSFLYLKIDGNVFKLVSKRFCRRERTSKMAKAKFRPSGASLIKRGALSLEEKDRIKQMFKKGAST